MAHSQWLASEWEDHETQTLIRLWGDGLSASEIASRLRERSRDAVIGKAHRLKLAPRPSPIKRSA